MNAYDLEHNSVDWEASRHHLGAYREPLNIAAEQHLGVMKDLDEECSRILFVGEDNPLSVASEYALYNYPPGCAGNRLQEKILGLHENLYLACWRTNLCVGRWSMKTAKTRASQIVTADCPWDVIIMLGRKVAEGCRDRCAGEALSPFKIGELSTPCGQDPWGQYVMKTITLVSLPHPSGRNTIWNDPQVALNARALLREVVPGIPWGLAP